MHALRWSMEDILVPLQPIKLILDKHTVTNLHSKKFSSRDPEAPALSDLLAGFHFTVQHELGKESIADPAVLSYRLPKQASTLLFGETTEGASSSVHGEFVKNDETDRQQARHLCQEDHPTRERG